MSDLRNYRERRSVSKRAGVAQVSRSQVLGTSAWRVLRITRRECAIVTVGELRIDRY